MRRPYTELIYGSDSYRVSYLLNMTDSVAIAAGISQSTKANSTMPYIAMYPCGRLTMRATANAYATSRFAEIHN